MKRVIFLILLLVINIYAKRIILDKDDLIKINANKNKEFIINRLNQYSKLLHDTKKLPIYKKLVQVNNFFNKIFPVEDSKKYNSDDYWATPKEFMINGKGDCEDYVISKYFTLQELGIDKRNLYFAVVKVKGATDYHMVLLYKKGSHLLVLDNLNQKIIPLIKRDDLAGKYLLNEFESKLIEKNKATKNIKLNWNGDNRFEKLLKRVYEKNE